MGLNRFGSSRFKVQGSKVQSLAQRSGAEVYQPQAGLPASYGASLTEEEIPSNFPSEKGRTIFFWNLKQFIELAVNN